MRNTEIKTEEKIKTNKPKKRHFVRKAVEVGLVLFLFSLSASLAYASPITKDNITNLVNIERKERGLYPLDCDIKLENAAYLKANDMLERDYFEHYSDKGKFLSPWEFMTSNDYDYLYAGENLAMDFDTAEGVVGAWMNSPSHRKNILNPDFEDMCLGIVRGEYTDESGSRATNMITQMFGREKPTVLKIVDSVLDAFRSLF